MVAGIYAVQNTLTGEQYIGSSIDLPRRMREHRMRLRGGRHTNRVLQSAWTADGEAAFRFVELMYTKQEDLRAFEQVYLDLMAPTYNVAAVALPNGLRGIKRSAATRARMSAAQKGKRNRLGMHNSEQWKQHMSALMKGRVISPETREKLRQANLGKTPSAETRAKISAANVGRAPRPAGWHHTEEAKLKIRAHRHSAETRERIRLAGVGRVLSGESKERIRLSTIKSWRPGGKRRRAQEE